MWNLSKPYRPTLQVRFSPNFMDVYHIQRLVYSTNCQHMFCAKCLLEWWTSSRATTCPNCRAVCENVPVQDRSNRLASLISGNPNETAGSFDANRFAELMVEIRAETEENQGIDVQEVIVMDYAFMEGAGTSTDPLDLTETVWI